MLKTTSKIHHIFIMRTIATVLAVTLLVFMPVPEFLASAGVENGISAEAATYTSVYVVTTPAGLNIRSGPGTSYKKVGTLSGGAVFTALNSSKNGWLQISYGKYVCRDYVAKCSSFIDWDYEVRHGIIVKTSGSNRLNLRSGPSESFRIVAKIPNGTRLKPSYKYNGWCYVTYKGHSGWISMKYTKNDYY